MSESENVLSLPSCRSNLFNPADSYVKTLGSKRSQTTVENCVQNIAKSWGTLPMTELNGPNLEGVTGKKFWVLLKRKGAHLQLKIFT